MPELIIYATQADTDAIVQWINDQRDIAWIVKVDENEGLYHWKAQSTIEKVFEQEYHLWPTESGPLNIPSGGAVKDALVFDPFKGWNQRLPITGAETPWFGTNPNPCTFWFRETGRMDSAKLARSGFNWLGNRFACLGNPAQPAAIQFWKRLRRFVERSTYHVPWNPPVLGKRGFKAFVFPNAQAQLEQGREREINP